MFGFSEVLQLATYPYSTHCSCCTDASGYKYLLKNLLLLQKLAMKLHKITRALYVLYLAHHLEVSSTVEASGWTLWQEQGAQLSKQFSFGYNYPLLLFFP